MNHFKTTVIKQHAHNHARVTQVDTPHGQFTTPCFMPVATRAYVNLLSTPQLRDTGTQIILGGNTYHMLLTPGMEIIESAGGMHPFMDWHGPMLTDSGGFQVFSLSKNSDICKIDEQGAHFKHPSHGKVIHLTPESSLATQKIIGADIIMAFDQCTPNTDDKALVKKIMERTHRWLAESVEYQQRQPNSRYGKRQALFGIIQGGNDRHLREQSAQAILSQPIDGVAVGGESIGFDMHKTIEILHWLQALLPTNKTRYTMGVGMHPQDLIDVVAEGIDIFDCVAPTRNARHGALFCGEIVEHNNWLRFDSTLPRGRLQIKKACYAKDERPIMPGCACYTCQHISRAYLHYLFREKSVAYSQYACIHNIHVMQAVCQRMQAIILNSA